MNSKELIVVMIIWSSVFMLGLIWLMIENAKFKAQAALITQQELVELIDECEQGEIK